MNDVTQILKRIESGDGAATDELLPLIYNELRRFAARQLDAEIPGQTLDATGLVHEAYLRLAGDQKFENRFHFFAAAATAMRRILVERSRKRNSLKAGGEYKRIDLEDLPHGGPEHDEELIALDLALDRLSAVEPQAAQLVQLRYFAGCTLAESAELLKMPLRSTNRLWAYARAWLSEEIRPK